MEKAAAFAAYVKPRRAICCASCATCRRQPRCAFLRTRRRSLCDAGRHAGPRHDAGQSMVKQVLDAFDGDCVISFSGMTPDGRFGPDRVATGWNNDPPCCRPSSEPGGYARQQTAEGEYVFNSGDVRC